MEQLKGLSREAYTKFKDGLLSRKIVPGTTLSQSDLADLLSVSVSPLRNALKILENEGFVSVLPRSGIRIRKPDLELIKNSYQLRKIIEDAAIVRFAETCPPDELEAIRQRHRDIVTKAEAKDADIRAVFDEMSQIDWGFHQRVVDSLQNPLIASTYKTNHERILLIRLDRHKATLLYIRNTMGEHEAVLDALLDNDIEAARAALSDHLNSAIRRAMGL
ncbi:GntR family transcriptional regulator [Bauldia sp.]|uniref:GntR family transcriptional regulator n=1 Tax=Bauldia sp. TaxID=2575872 RepID=UPI003BABF72A